MIPIQFMKKENYIVLIGIILILSMSFISAGFFDWFKDLFIKEESIILSIDEEQKLSSQSMPYYISYLRPSISENKIVWKGNLYLYLYDLSTNKETKFYRYGSNHDITNPVIYKNKVVWSEKAVNTTLNAWVSYVKVYDIAENKTRIISEKTGSYLAHIDISENKIIRTDSTNGYLDIYVYNLSSGVEKKIASGLREFDRRVKYFSISGNKVVWMNYANDKWGIYMYNLLSSQQTTISEGSLNKESPDISENKIVWKDARNSGYDIYMFDLSSEKETRITPNPLPSTQIKDPKFSKDKIVWYSDEEGNDNIYLHDLKTNKTNKVIFNEEHQQYPDIFENKIVWADMRFSDRSNPAGGKYDVYLYDVGECNDFDYCTKDNLNPQNNCVNTIITTCISGDKCCASGCSFDDDNDCEFGTQITNNNSDEFSPYLFNNKIVYIMEKENKTDIYSFDINTKNKEKISNNGYSISPSIYNNTIVWYDYRHAPPTYTNIFLLPCETGASNSEIYSYNLNTKTETRLTDHCGHQSSPIIYKDKIVMTDRRSPNINIYLKDLETNDLKAITDKKRELNPYIYEDKIIWISARNDEDISDSNEKNDIYMYDLSTNKETRIANSSSVLSFYRLAFYKDNIVWTDKRNSNYDIYMYDISSNQETQITNNSKSQINPSVYKNLIVWLDDRNSLRGDYYDVYTYDIELKEESRLTNRSYEIKDLFFYDNTLVWSDKRNGNWDVYYYEIKEGKCIKNSSCNDSIACTINDICKNGICQGTPNNSLCSSSETCTLGRGCIQTSCSSCSNCDGWFDGCNYGECVNQCSVADACYFKGIVSGDNCIKLGSACLGIKNCEGYSKEECVNNRCDVAPSLNGCIVQNEKCVNASYCGDSMCDSNENCENCIKDCKCLGDKVCINKKCIINCFDKDSDTYDNCSIGEPGDDGKKQDCDDNDNKKYPGLQEVCDNKDNNCDENVDNNLTQETTCGLGVCSGNKGNESCVAGNWIGNTCDAFLGNSSEVCEGSLDEDCDGSIDEGCDCINGRTKQCGSSNVGVCKYGLQTCANGKWGLCVGNIEPTPDSNCDNLDNNCNGEVDENYIEVGTICGKGICAGNTGKMQCINGVEKDSCNPYFEAISEVCENITGYDGLDNNCDGKIDLNCNNYCDKDEDGYTPKKFPLCFGYKRDDCNDNNILIWQKLKGFPDSDKDSYGAKNQIEICSGKNLPKKYVNNSNDCDDNNKKINPNSKEICDNKDNDCDGKIDENNGNCSQNKPYCSSGKCVECQLDSNCNDNIFCNGIETCSSIKVCQKEKPITCNDNNKNTYDFCNESKNSCQSIDIVFDEDNDKIPNSFDKCPKTPSKYREKVNNKGCPKPHFGQFDMITNLTDINLLNISDFYIGKKGIGKIKFKENISLIKKINGEGIPLNLSFINISKGKIEINSSKLTELNKSAELTMIGLNLTSPRILRNGRICSDCKIISWNQTLGTLIFETSKFSIYEIIEAFCGDGYCDDNIGENCGNCILDCGSCPITPGSSSNNKESEEITSSNGKTTKPTNNHCTQNWVCGDWGNCINNIKTRKCNDLNNCKIDSQTPQIQKECISNIIGQTKEEQETKSKITYPLITYTVAISIIILIFLIIALLLLRKFLLNRKLELVQYYSQHNSN